MFLRKNVIVNNRRTSICLRKKEWEALEDICRREHIKLNELCSEIDRQRGKTSLTSEIREFLLTYFRDIVREQEEKENISPWNYRQDMF